MQETIIVLDVWRDCEKFLPYRDWQGSFRWPSHTQCRRIQINGRTVWQYREREETQAEYDARQW
jgi:hypothetical protein